MADPVNLNRFRKQKAKVQGQVQANENAVKFGQSKAQKDQVKAQGAKAKRDLDRHEVER